jgi:hypothetical protein
MFGQQIYGWFQWESEHDEVCVWTPFERKDKFLVPKLQPLATCWKAEMQGCNT